MSINKKIISLALAMVLLCVLSCSSVMAYGNSRPGSVAGISLTFSSYISQDLRSTNAVTSSGNGNVNAYVNAYFFYTDESTGISGSWHGYQGNYGSASTGFVSTDAKFFYRVESNHSGSYNGETCSYSGLVTSITGN